MTLLGLNTKFTIVNTISIFILDQVQYNMYSKRCHALSVKKYYGKIISGKTLQL